MSRKNSLKYDWEDIIFRLKSHTGCKTQSELADIFNISSNDFSMRKKKGTLVQLIIPWAIHEKVSLDWIFYGTKAVSINQQHGHNDFFSELIDFEKRDKSGFIKLKDHIKSFIAGRDSFREEIETDEERGVG
jgi:hypothetical protein